MEKKNLNYHLALKITIYLNVSDLYYFYFLNNNFTIQIYTEYNL